MEGRFTASEVNEGREKIEESVVTIVKWRPDRELHHVTSASIIRIDPGVNLKGQIIMMMDECVIGKRTKSEKMKATCHILL